MPAVVSETSCTWLHTGYEFFPAMLGAIEGAQESVCLETYIFAAGSLGDQFRAALTRAQERGVRVRVLIDAFGSYGLPAGFWARLTQAGGEVRVFNPLSLHRWAIRNHRKLLVCDEKVGFVGGFNIAPEYDGDGVSCGWCDLGLKIEGPLARELGHSFEEMYGLADFKHRPFVRLRKARAKRTVFAPHEQLLLSGPGRGRSPILRAFRRDLDQARSVQIVAAYFLPTWKLRRRVAAVAGQGGLVQLILAGKSDVRVSQLAGRSLYRRLLQAGAQIYEYQPQILHAKLVIIDDAVYVGSANFDLRSLHFNYELMIRFHNKQLAAQARTIFDAQRAHCRPITLEAWRKSRTLWQRIKQRWAYLLLVRIDPYIARWQWRGLPD
jgi:cardiolipin synthase A/B